MSHSASMTRIYVFVLVLNLVFPVLSYTFLSFGEQSERYETSLDPDSLMTIGINLVDAESHVLTFGAAGWEEYLLVNVSIRARWATHRRLTLPDEDGIRLEKQSAISKAFNSFLIPYTVPVKSVASNEWFTDIRNDTIVRDFNPRYNWSRFVIKDGHHIFITSFLTDGNITKAVYDDGILNLTIAKSFDEDTTFNFWRFMGWYSSLLIGDQSWGLPSIFSWVLRILGALSVFAVVMLTRDLIPI